jgi:hypothetical protein
MKKYFMDYTDAQKEVYKLGLKSALEWQKYCVSGLKNKLIPSSPNTVYKDKGWDGWRKWLGNDFLSFKESRDIVHTLKINTCREWKKYMRDKDIGIPHDPQVFYRDNGWGGWKDWLGHQRKFNQNSRVNWIYEDFFKLWSHDMAYILGLWFADGYISKSFAVGITLHKNDSELLNNIVNLIGGKIYTRDNCLNLIVSSKTVFQDIVMLGGQEKKSLILKMPFIPKEYLKDFIRGYFDGDGSIFYAKKDKAYYATITCGNEQFLRALEVFLKQEIDDFTCYITSRTRNVTIKGVAYKNIFSSEMRMNATNTKKFGEYIYYPNSKLKMKRKFDLFLKIGIIKVANKNKSFLEFDDAKNHIKSIGILNSMEWLGYCRSGEKPSNIPSNPNKIYKNKGWINWADWLSKPIKI